MELKTIIKNAMEQILQAVASLCNTHHQPLSHAMDTEVEHSMHIDKGLMAHETTNPTMLDLANIVQDLKYEIATIVTES